ncbi:polysaccharide biosynthesis tyrosine autokinase [Leptolyngbya sp. NK1-12]|uniref:non-specific protein-tyrosine kinase n=1 Tax=Leptolyngbya sp. NK1-12 TaxID=2547451 RepID=A0AA97AHY7_9CYAN|nr:polysaccharide biosynthesis tyrosine autokinase [Leptolyngbya sp. NK1-12]WNZ25034.1 polysaccharide biosynthesis tyrosine autokinase [Leptolyngbya sp. NK1-12]
MEIEQTTQASAAQASAPMVRGRPVVQLAPPDVDDLDNAPNRGLNLRSLGRTIQRQALLIAGVATVVAVAAGFQAMKIRPVYEGNFQLLVEPVSNAARVTDPLTVTRTQGDNIPSGDVFTLDYSTQIEILQSPSMLTSIVQEVKTQYPEFTYDQLRAGLKVQRLVPENAPDATRIIKVTYEDPNPELVQHVLKVTADRYLRYSLEERKTRFGEGIKFIDDQLPEAQQRVNSIQDELQRLQQQYDLISPASQGDQLSTNINEITTQQLATQRELQEQRALYNSLQRQLELTPEEGIAASALSEDPTYQTLQQNLVEIDRQLAVESARFNDDSPVVRSLRERQRNVSNLLSQRAQQIVGQSLPGGSGNPQVQAFQNSVRIGLINQMVEAGNQIRVLEVRNREIAQARQAFDRRFQQFPAISRQYTDLTRELEIATQTLNRLQTQRETLRVEAAQTEVPWEMVSEPLIPRDAEGNPVPEPTKASNLMIAGAALGLLLGTLLALLLERYRNVFYTVEDLQEAIKLPLIGVIPFSRGAKQSLEFPSSFGGGDFEDSRLETASFREAFSDLYSNIRLADPPIRSLMVCSAEPGDGKTTVALYLAQTAAGTGQRVLLVDTNLRLPQIHTRLDLRNSKGLSDLLTGDANPEEMLQRSPLAENLFVLTAGSSMPGSARLLGSDQMKYLMEKFQSMFDLVIYDTPHLFGLTDASFLTTQVDEVLMVVAANKTNRTAVERVLNKLMSLRIANVSMVANYLREHNSPSSNAYTRYNQNLLQARRDGSALDA